MDTRNKEQSSISQQDKNAMGEGERLYYENRISKLERRVDVLESLLQRLVGVLKEKFEGPSTSNTTMPFEDIVVQVSDKPIEGEADNFKVIRTTEEGALEFYYQADPTTGWERVTPNDIVYNKVRTEMVSMGADIGKEYYCVGYGVSRQEGV
jgi:hypothetical protein